MFFSYSALSQHYKNTPISLNIKHLQKNHFDCLGYTILDIKRVIHLKMDNPIGSNEVKKDKSIRINLLTKSKDAYLQTRAIGTLFEWPSRSKALNAFGLPRLASLTSEMLWVRENQSIIH